MPWSCATCRVSPSNSLNMHSIPNISNISDTLLDQKSPVHQEPRFPGGDKQTDIATYRPNRPRADRVKIVLRLIVLTSTHSTSAGRFFFVRG